MNASYEWLKAFVPFTLSPAELRDLITSRCATVDEIIALRADLEPIVVARVVEAKRHPNSDHLWVTKVDAGDGSLTDVVCGAPNVQEGRLYPFAPVGTTMPGGLVIERRKIRGETSAGMLCSARELGLGVEHDGIMTLDVDARPGTPLLAALPVGDTRIVIDTPANRADLLSHVGIAREVAAATELPLGLPAIPASEGGDLGSPNGTPAGAAFTITVEPAGDVPRYVGLEMRGIKVGPSPSWLVQRLEAIGARSINNVVDATNYVMHELGQPLHAFDADTLAGRRVVVRRARPGERLVTLDGVERALDPEMTVIADAERAQAIAGVMGGRDSEVTAATTAIFIESAVFDARGTRATRRRLNLSTDASYRFERGVDPELPLFALERVVSVIGAVAGGAAVGAPVDVYPAPAAPVSIPLRVARVAKVLGEAVAEDEIARLLGLVAFGVAPLELGVLRVAVPSWRADVRQEVDLVEEVARLWGYDRLSDRLRPFRVGTTTDAPEAVVARRVRDALVGAGLLEVRPMPFVKGAATGYVRVANPLSEAEAYLRTDLLESLARRAEHNLAHMLGDLRIFEIGHAFAPGGPPLPVEEMRAAALVLGRRRPPHFTEKEPPPFDEWDAKGIAELMATTAFPGRAVRLEPADGTRALWMVEVDGVAVGSVREIALDAPVWAPRAFGVEITLARVGQAVEGRPGVELGTPAHGRGFVDPVSSGEREGGAPVAPQYRALATTPAAEIDVALVVPDAVRAAEVERVVRRDAGELLEELALLEEFRGGTVPDGHRSLLWRLTFRHPERTLRDKEVEGRRAKLLRTLESELGVKQRS